jgi:hypothetical protein
MNLFKFFADTGSNNQDACICSSKRVCKSSRDFHFAKRFWLVIFSEISFENIPVEAGSSTEYPLDLISPGLEGEHVAYTNPGHGRIPERSVESDYVMIPTYGITSSIDYLLRYAREARWDIVGRAMQVMEAGFVKKMNDDGWHTLLAAGVDRNIVVYDGDATAGTFTKRLVSLMQLITRRNAGGNSGSANRGRMTDLYVSPEALEDVRNWGLDQVSDVIRTQIYNAPENGAPITKYLWCKSPRSR